MAALVAIAFARMLVLIVAVVLLIWVGTGSAGVRGLQAKLIDRAGDVLGWGKARFGRGRRGLWISTVWFEWPRCGDRTPRCISVGALLGCVETGAVERAQQGVIGR